MAPSSAPSPAEATTPAIEARRARRTRTPSTRTAARLEAFAAGLAQLAAYRAEKGDALVPRSYETADGYALGAWVGTQRRAYKAGRLSEEQLQELRDAYRARMRANQQRGGGADPELRAVVARGRDDARALRGLRQRGDRAASRVGGIGQRGGGD